MMADVGKILALLGTVFLVMLLVLNIMPHKLRIPGDIDIDRPGIKIYIPFASAIILSVALTLIFNFFRK